MNSHCRIGRIKLKSGGEIHLLPGQEKDHCFKSVENLAKSIDSDTYAVGFFVMGHDRELITGCSYKEGFTPVDLYGACDYMKQNLFNKVWKENPNG